MSVQELRQIYLQIRKHFADIEKVFGKMECFGSDHYEDIFGKDFARFIYYLAASDGVLAEAERRYINEITGANESTRDMISTIIKSGMATAGSREDFAKTPMISFIICLVADEVMIQSGVRQKPVFPILISFFTEVGVGLVSVDGTVTQGEKEDLVRVINTMAETAKKEIQKGAFSLK